LSVGGASLAAVDLSARVRRALRASDGNLVSERDADNIHLGTSLNTRTNEQLSNTSGASGEGGSQGVRGRHAGEADGDGSEVPGQAQGDSVSGDNPGSIGSSSSNTLRTRLGDLGGVKTETEVEVESGRASRVGRAGNNDDGEGRLGRPVGTRTLRQGIDQNGVLNSVGSQEEVQVNVSGKSNQRLNVTDGVGSGGSGTNRVALRLVAVEASWQTAVTTSPTSLADASLGGGVTGTVERAVVRAGLASGLGGERSSLVVLNSTRVRVQPILEDARGLTSTGDGSIRITSNANVEAASVELSIGDSTRVQLQANLVGDGDKSSVTIARISGGVDGARILGIATEGNITEVNILGDGGVTIADTHGRSVGQGAIRSIQVQINLLVPTLDGSHVTDVGNDDSKGGSVPVVVDTVAVIEGARGKGNPRLLGSPLVEGTLSLIGLILRQEEEVVVGADGCLTDNSGRWPPGDVTLEGTGLKLAAARGEGIGTSHIVVEGSPLNTMEGRTQRVPEPSVVVRITRTVATHHIVNLGSEHGVLESRLEQLGAGVRSNGDSHSITALIHESVEEQILLIISGQGGSVGEGHDGAGGLSSVPHGEVVDKTVPGGANRGSTVSAAQGTNGNGTGQGDEVGSSGLVVVDCTTAIGIDDNHHSVPLATLEVGDLR